MDRDAFDGLTKLLAASPNRRSAVGALLGTGLAGMLTAVDAKKGRKKKRKGGKGGKGGSAYLSAEAADCLSPGPSSNISGCPFQDEDFSSGDLSGSRMVATNFRGAELVGTNLSSSNAKSAIFREADLTCANLRSSTLGGADFRAADLTLANLKSSGGCNTATFNGATTFCGTVMCDGSVRNDDCAGGPPAGTCCRDDDCPPGKVCAGGTCACPAELVELPNGSCALACANSPQCGAAGGNGCLCLATGEDDQVCATGSVVGQCPTNSSAACPPESVCSTDGVCFSLCGIGPATD